MSESAQQASGLRAGKPSTEAVGSVARMGRPPRKAAHSHEAIMDAVYELLQEVPARHLTMEAVARRANVGRPTLYKWWPSKAALLMAMFHERLAGNPDKSVVNTVEASVSIKMQRVVTSLNGLFGKVMGDLVAEGQSDPKVLQDLHSHIRKRRARSVAEIEQGKSTGEFRHDINSEIVVDLLLGPLYYRLLLGFRPLTRAYAGQLTRQVMQAIKVPVDGKAKRPRAKLPAVPAKKSSQVRGQDSSMRQRPKLQSKYRS